MAEILLFHHAHGQTRGFLAFADELRAAGNVVHTPDLYDGKTFTDLDDGVGYAKEVGFATIGERGRLAADGLPNELVYAGFSLGAMPAQELVETIEGAELFLYPGDRHLFADNSLPDYDEGTAKLLKQRVLSFLDK